MLESMPSPILSEWMAFASLEPFGFEADMLGHAITSSTVANVNRNKGQKAFVPDDFMPKEKRQASQEEIFEKMKMMKRFAEKRK